MSRDAEVSDELTFKQMQKRYGLTRRALRYYEFLELVTPRRDGAQRYYDRREQARMILILRGKRFGLRLEDVRLWLELYEEQGEAEQMRAWIDIAREQLPKIREEIAEREAALSDLQCSIAEAEQKLDQLN